MRAISKKDIGMAQLLWDHFLLHQYEPPKKVDLIVCLGSIDTLPVELAAQHYLERRSRLPYLLIAGGTGRFWDKRHNHEKYRKYQTEADLLADVAVNLGVPKDSIILSKNSTNTYGNYEAVRDTIKQYGWDVKSILSVHMPHAERRDWGTAKKILPGNIEIVVTSPDVPMITYHERGFLGLTDLEDTIEALVGNYQRCGYYPELGWMVPQPDLFPGSVWDAYEHLISGGYTGEMLRDGAGRLLRSRENKNY